MKKLLQFLMLFFCTTIVFAQKKQPAVISDRKLWLSYMDKISRPVIMNLAEGKLKEKMPVVLSQRVDNKTARTEASYLEAFGRTLNGISAWMNGEGGSNEEIALRNQYREWTLKAIKNAVDPSSPDYMKWTGGQPLVDASFFALGLIRSPWLWQHLDTATQNKVVTALKISRSTIPAYSNWILFTAMIEAFLCKYGYDYDPVRIEYAIREFSHHWYLGDATFSDGMEYHNDYYNSYVIQPYLSAILPIVASKSGTYRAFAEKLDKITKRYAEIQERAINADGSFSVTGRSITYRGGAFHHLAAMVLQQQLPTSLKPAQVRGALTAVLKKTMEPASTFTKDGWLNIGLYGHQPGLAEGYINTGSIYLCAAIFLPLGLPETDPFWSSSAEPWTSVKVWRGEDLPADHALDLK